MDTSFRGTVLRSGKKVANHDERVESDSVSSASSMSASNKDADTADDRCESGPGAVAAKTLPCPFKGLAWHDHEKDSSACSKIAEEMGRAGLVSLRAVFRGEVENAAQGSNDNNWSTVRGKGSKRKGGVKGGPASPAAPVNKTTGRSTGPSFSKSGPLQKASTKAGKAKTSPTSAKGKDLDAKGETDVLAREGKSSSTPPRSEKPMVVGQDRGCMAKQTAVISGPPVNTEAESASTDDKGDVAAAAPAGKGKDNEVIITRSDSDDAQETIPVQTPAAQSTPKQPKIQARSNGAKPASSSNSSQGSGKSAKANRPSAPTQVTDKRREQARQGSAWGSATSKHHAQQHMSESTPQAPLIPEEFPKPAAGPSNLQLDQWTVTLIQGNGGSMDFFKLPEPYMRQHLLSLFGDGIRIKDKISQAKKNKAIRITANSRLQYVKLKSVGAATASHPQLRLQALPEKKRTWFSVVVPRSFDKTQFKVGAVTHARGVCCLPTFKESIRFERMAKYQHEGRWVYSRVRAIFSVAGTQLPEKICIDGRWIEAEGYTFQVQHCRKCCRYTHHHSKCRNQVACGFCAQGHRSEDCPHKEDKDKIRCKNCNGSHPVWSSDCQIRREREELNAVKAGRPLTDKQAREELERLERGLATQPSHFDVGEPLSAGEEHENNAVAGSSDSESDSTPPEVATSVNEETSLSSEQSVLAEQSINTKINNCEVLGAHMLGNQGKLADMLFDLEHKHDSLVQIMIDSVPPKHEFCSKIASSIENHRQVIISHGKGILGLQAQLLELQQIVRGFLCLGCDKAHTHDEHCTTGSKAPRLQGQGKALPSSQARG